MARNGNCNPWSDPDRIIEQIRGKIDHGAIEAVAPALGAPSGDENRKKLKGIYFDADVAEALDGLKRRRVNVSGLVNEAVRAWLDKQNS